MPDTVPQGPAETPRKTRSRRQSTCREILGFDSGETESIADLGFRLYEQGRVTDAEAIFHGLIALDGHVYHGYAGLGAIAVADEKLQEAVGGLQRAAEQQPENPGAHADLSEAFLRQGRFELAAAEFRKALDLDPQAADPGVNRARAIVDGIRLVIERSERARAKH